MTTEQLAIIVPGAIAIRLAGLNIWYQHWLTNRTLEQQADLTQQTLDHQRTLARERRMKEQRFGICLELLTALRRLEMSLIRTAPLFGPALEPPPPLSDEEVWHLSAIADVGASEQVSTSSRRGYASCQSSTPPLRISNYDMNGESLTR
jgi:hypothetical protein